MHVAMFLVVCPTSSNQDLHVHTVHEQCKVLVLKNLIRSITASECQLQFTCMSITCTHADVHYMCIMGWS